MASSEMDVDVKMDYCRLCGCKKLKPDNKLRFHNFYDEVLLSHTYNDIGRYQISGYPQMSTFEDDSSHNTCDLCISCKDKVQTTAFSYPVTTAFSNPVDQPLLDHIEEYPHSVDVDKPSIMYSSNAETLKFTKFMPEVPQAVNGGPNTSISVMANSDERPALSTLVQRRLEELNESIYAYYVDIFKNCNEDSAEYSDDDIAETHHKTLTATDIQNELENLNLSS